MPLNKRNARSNKSSRQQSPRILNQPLRQDVEPAVERLVDIAFHEVPSSVPDLGLNWDIEFANSWYVASSYRSL
jgi:hypothetical protein